MTHLYFVVDNKLSMKTSSKKDQLLLMIRQGHTMTLGQQARLVLSLSTPAILAQLTTTMMQYIDVLVDGEFMADKKDVKLLWKGSSNQRVIDVQKSLKQTDPVIPVLHCGDYSYGNH